MMASDSRSTSPANSSGAAACGGAATVYCAADAAALCVPCDAAVHAANPLSSRHDRVPLAVAMAAASSGEYDHLFAADDDASSWAAAAAQGGQGQGSPNDSSSSFTNDSAGWAERNLFDLLSDVDIMSCGGGGGAGFGGLASSLDGVAPDGSEPPLWLHPGQLATLTSWSPADAVVVPAAAAAAREERVRRYREKRKNRKFQKTIRYASRKAYAEARPRIKGRFVKRASSSDDDSTAVGAGAGATTEEDKFWLSFPDDGRTDGVGFYMDNAATAYGIVPTF